MKGNKRNSYRKDSSTVLTATCLRLAWPNLSGEARCRTGEEGEGLDLISSQAVPGGEDAHFRLRWYITAAPS